MHCLNRTISQIEQGGMDREINRKQAVIEIESVIAQCQEAMKEWQEYLKSPGAPGDKWSVLSWVGPQRAKRLHEISLEARAHMIQACMALGAVGGHVAALEDSVVVSAYGQLPMGQAGMDAANTAVQKMQQDIKHLDKVIERIKSAPAVKVKKPVPKTSSAAKPAAKKAAGGKKAAPAKKPAAKKKAAGKKKPVGKKKAVTKKKPAAGKGKTGKKSKKR